MLGEQLFVDGDSLFADPSVGSAASGQTDDRRSNSARNIVDVPVRLRPANTSQRSLHAAAGNFRDVSTTGCGLILDYPPHVGDIYRFEIAQANHSAFDGILGRCVRCRFIDEDVFEAGFQFLTPLPQPAISDGLL